MSLDGKIRYTIVHWSGLQILKPVSESIVKKTSLKRAENTGSNACLGLEQLALQRLESFS